MKCLVFVADKLQPFVNQAIEATLLKLADDDTEILYLWKNDKTVVIGKNQNAYTECNVSQLENDGGFVARRISGGGAVYHDKGNLNFTFVSSRNNYNVAKNFEIMTDAMRSLGFEVSLSGRNDVLLNGRKFSGNAFYKGNDACFHHGTILIKTSPEIIAKYLKVSKVKLEAKGVKSVVSRVINLSDVLPVTAEQVTDSLIKSFGSYYKQEPVRITEADLPSDELAKQIAFFSDEKWRHGDDVHYDARIERRFSWGTADIRLKLNGDVIEDCKIYSDSLDDVTERQNLLIGADINVGKEGVNDIIEAFKEQENGF